MKHQKIFEPTPGGHQYALDLVKQDVDHNKGKYLNQVLENQDPYDFCIGKAGYPEKHYESPSLKSDPQTPEIKGRRCGRLCGYPDVF